VCIYVIVIRFQPQFLAIYSTWGAFGGVLVQFWHVRHRTDEHFCLCSCPAFLNLPRECPHGECFSALFYCFTTPCCPLLNSCPSYSNLPPECPLVTPPGECCGTPQCNFQGTGGTSTGTGTGTVTGGGTGTRMLIPRVFTWQNRPIV